MATETDPESVDALATFRQFFALERDVLILSVAMFAFSLGFQMTSRYVPEYMAVLGATPFVIGVYGTFANVISAVYPYCSVGFRQSGGRVHGGDRHRARRNRMLLRVRRGVRGVRVSAGRGGRRSRGVVGRSTGSTATRFACPFAPVTREALDHGRRLRRQLYPPRTGRDSG